MIKISFVWKWVLFLFLLCESVENSVSNNAFMIQDEVHCFRDNLKVCLFEFEFYNQYLKHVDSTIILHFIWIICFTTEKFEGSLTISAIWSPVQLSQWCLNLGVVRQLRHK